MNTLITMASLFGFLVITFLGSRRFYYAYLRNFSNKILIRYGYKLSDLKYSFEEITYFVTLPTNNPLLANSSREDLVAEKEFISWLYPSIRGLKIIMQTEKGEQFIAYLSREKFRLPLLDKLLFQKEIDEETYNQINSYKLIHPATIKEILDEVHYQLNSSKYL